MATALQIVNRAMRLCGVLDAGAAAAAGDASDALETLNALLAEMHSADVGLPDYNLATLQDTLASDAADREALAYALAVRIAPEYGVTLSALVATAAQQSMSRLRLRYFQPGKTDYSELPSTWNYLSISDFNSGNF